MTPIEQAREALPDYVERALGIVQDHFDLRRSEMLASLSPSTPVDGVGAEPVAWQGITKNGRFIVYELEQNAVKAASDPISNVTSYRPLYAAPLANPEAEARLRERVAELEAREIPDDNHYWSKRALVAEARLAQAERGPAVTEAAKDVLAERRRQVEAEGWTPDHDDTYANGELAAAATCYAFTAARSPHHIQNQIWPWSSDWWKPAGKRRNLVKAGALILAEIERLDRAALHPQSAAGEEGKP